MSSKRHARCDQGLPWTSISTAAKHDAACSKVMFKSNATTHVLCAALLLAMCRLMSMSFTITLKLQRLPATGNAIQHSSTVLQRYRKVLCRGEGLVVGRAKVRAQ